MYFVELELLYFNSYYTKFGPSVQLIIGQLVNIG